MSVKFSVPSSPAKSVFEIKQFLGVDLTNTGSNIDERRSPNAPNMVRDVPGKVRKRRGYQKLTRPQDDIFYGAHPYNAFKQIGDVVNINRLKYSSSNSFVISAPQSSSTSRTKWFELADGITPNRKVYYDFWYRSSGNARIMIGDTVLTEITEQTDYVHVSGSVTTGQMSAHINGESHQDAGKWPLYLASENYVYANFKSASIVYAKDDDFVWNRAPEDNGYTFPFKSTYFSKGFNQKNDVRFYYENHNTLGFGVTLLEVGNIESDCDGIILTASWGIAPTSSGDGTYDISLKYGSYSRSIFSGNKNSFGWSKPISIPAYWLGSKLDSIHVNWSSSNITNLTLFLNDISLEKIKNINSLESGTDSALYHVGNSLYRKIDNGYSTVFSSYMNRYPSKSFQFGEYLYVIDGMNYLRFNVTNNNIENVITYEKGYVPTVMIGKSPTGGGTPYEDLNLISNYFIEQFTCDNDLYPGSESATTFQLSYGDIEYVANVEVLNSSGAWIPKSYIANKKTGVVSLDYAPGKTPITGQDNVRIKVKKIFEGYADRIRKCTIGTTYGVGGASDRLFLSGNPSYPNQDWYSQQNDPTYFPDTSYSVLGLDKSAIVGYSIINNYLATHKDENEPSQSVIIREGNIVDNEAVFKIVNTLQGAGAIAPRTFAYLETEPLFLTRKGIFAITAQDVTGEKYGQDRSFYLNGRLLEEANLENASAIVYNDMYLLSINNKLYILDGLQSMQTDKSDPYATRQYAGFYCTNIPATCMWVQDGDLYFGSSDGYIYKFYSDKDDTQSYNDNGAAIEAWWETPDLDGKLFFKNKTFRYIAIRLMASIATSITIYGMKRGIWSEIMSEDDIWTFIKRDNSSGRYFSFANITFSKFTWSVDKGEKVSHSKLRIKKVDKARFKLENKELNEPFGISNFAVEYVESGNYKG